MNTQTKAEITHTAGVEAAKLKFANELGVTLDELDVIRAFSALLTKRADEAPSELFVAAGDTHLRKKMPHNDDALDAYREDTIEYDALRYIEENTLGRSVGNLQFPAPLEKAKEQLTGASRRLMNSPADEHLEVSYAKAVRWLAQMQAQDVLKKALCPIFEAVYRVQTGGLYATPEKTNAAVSTDETLNALMG